MITLIDQDIAHITRVMLPSLHGDLGGPILPSTYWRKRLHQLLEVEHLSKAQLCSVDSLLLQLDDFDTGSRRRDTAPPLQAFARHV